MLEQRKEEGKVIRNIRIRKNNEEGSRTFLFISFFISFFITLFYMYIYI
jgi:hypothetical protein